MYNNVSPERNLSLSFMKALPPCLLPGLALFLSVAAARADTLFFRGSSANFLWSSISNWYLSDGAGGYVPAGRLPNAPDNVILQTGPDGAAGVFEVNTMILEGVLVTNGAFSAHSIQMGDGSTFAGSVVTVLGGGQLQVLSGPIGCVLATVTLTIQGGADLYLSPGAALTLTAGTFIYDEGAVILTAMSLLTAAGPNTLDILPGAQLLSSGAASVTGAGFTLNNNGTIVGNSGALALTPQQ
jgi:hypothetical protein